MAIASIRPLVNSNGTQSVSSQDDKREFYPIDVAQWPAEFQAAYAEHRQIVEMLKASRARLDSMFLPEINRLAPPPAGKEVALALNYGLFQYEYVTPKRKAAVKSTGLVFKPAK